MRNEKELEKENPDSVLIKNTASAIVKIIL